MKRKKKKIRFKKLPDLFAVTFPTHEATEPTHLLTYVQKERKKKKNETEEIPPAFTPKIHEYLNK